jgi:hypothetical protein
VLLVNDRFRAPAFCLNDVDTSVFAAVEVAAHILIPFDDAVVFDIPSIRLVALAVERLVEPANLGIIQVPAQITVGGSLVPFSDRQIVEVPKRDLAFILGCGYRTVHLWLQTKFVFERPGQNISVGIG